MPEELVFEDSRGNEFNQISDVYNMPELDRLQRGVSSPVLEITVRSLSSTHIFSGDIVVAPFGGTSYSEDIQISYPPRGAWGRILPVELLPSVSRTIRVRVLVQSTPSGRGGRGSIRARGSWDIAPAEV